MLKIGMFFSMRLFENSKFLCVSAYLEQYFPTQFPHCCNSYGDFISVRIQLNFMIAFGSCCAFLGSSALHCCQPCSSCGETGEPQTPAFQMLPIGHNFLHFSGLWFHVQEFS